MSCVSQIGVIVLSVLTLAGSARAEVIFSQTPASDVDGAPSDVDVGDNGFQRADDFILSSAQVARSVTWRGEYVAEGSPVAPLSFDLIFYANAGGLPDRANVVSTTSVVFSSLDEIEDTGLKVNDYTVYEFKANLNPTSLPSGTHWFSVLADTTNLPADDFYWTFDSFGSAASRNNVAGNSAFAVTNNENFYFVLDNAVVPEPVGIASLCLGGAMLLGRRARWKLSPSV